MTEPETKSDQPPFLHDSYLAWCEEQPVPVVENFGMDLSKLNTEPWGRYGMNGAICLLKGRDDYNSIFCFELTPGSKSHELHHLQL